MSKKVLLIFISVLILIGLIVMCKRPAYIPDNNILVNFEIAMSEGI